METVRQIVDKSAHRDFLVAEFARRGLHECATMIQTAEMNEILSSADMFDPVLDQAIYRIEVVDTDAIFDRVAVMMDETDPESDRHVQKTMLSPAEQAEDLIAVDAPPETIQAFIEAQGVSTISPSEFMAAELSQDTALGQDSELLATHEQSQDTGLSL